MALPSVAALVLVFASAFASGGESVLGQGMVVVAGGLGLVGLMTQPLGCWPRAMAMAACGWVLVVGWCFLQAAPIAEPLVPELQAAASALGHGHSRAWVLDPYAAESAGLRLAAYAGVFAIGLVLSGYRQAALTLIGIVIAGIVATALFLDPDTVGAASLGKVRHVGDVSFPFVSRNHFCAFAGIGCLIWLALWLREGRCWSRLGMGYALGLAICLAAALASHSRAGLFATAASMGIVGLCLRPPRSVTLIVAVVAGALTILLAATTIGRFESLDDALAFRLQIWSLAWGLAWEQPLTGLGSFDLAFQRVALPWPQGMVQSAHNIVLESLVERGWPATLLAGAAILLVLGQCARSITYGIGDMVPVATAIGVAALILLHGMVDFSVHAPTIAALVAVVLGLGAGTSFGAAAERPVPVSPAGLKFGNPLQGARK